MNHKPNEKRSFASRLPIVSKIAFAKVFILLSTTFLFGFGVPTHVAIANRTLDELEVSLGGSEPELVFHDLRVPIRGDRRAYDAILAFPEYFRMGAMGPDAFPDLISGQLFHHTNRGVLETSEIGGFPPFKILPTVPLPEPFPDLTFLVPGQYSVRPAAASEPYQTRTPETYRAIDFGTRMLEMTVSEFSNDPRMLAFTMGYLSHSVGDAFMHARVNELSGHYFTLFRGSGTYGKLTEEVKHTAVEELLDQLLPDELRNSDSNVNSFDRFIGTVPRDFLDLYYQRGPMWNHVGGKLYDFFEAQERTLSAVITELDPYSLLQPLEAQFRDLIIQTLNDITGGRVPQPAQQAFADFVIDAMLKDVPLAQFFEASEPFGRAIDRTEDLRRKLVAYRRNLLLLSECTMLNIIQAPATVLVKDHCREPEMLARITLEGIDDPFGLFRSELEDIFKGIGIEGAGDDFRGRAFNIGRLAKYITSSFVLGRFLEIILPLTPSQATGLIRDWIQTHQSEINQAFFFIPDFESLAIAASNGAVCTGQCLANDCPARLTECIGNAQTFCGINCVVDLPLLPPVNFCALNPCNRFDGIARDACDEFLGSFVLPAGVCAGLEFARNCNNEVAGCANCTANCVMDAAGRVESADVAGALLDALDTWDDLTAIAKDQITRFIIEPAACTVVLGTIPDIFIPLRKFATLQDFMFGGRNAAVGPDFFAANVAYLREDTRHPQYLEDLRMAAAGSQLALQAINRVANGEMLDLFVGPVERGLFSGDCFNFQYDQLDREGMAGALKDIDRLHVVPGPTALKLLEEFGSDPTRTFLPMTNTIAAVKLLPIRDKTDVEAMFSQAGVSSQAQNGLPWRNTRYSNNCSNAGDGSINILCDAVSSNDDPECFSCAVDCEGRPPENACSLDVFESGPDPDCDGCVLRRPQHTNATRADLEFDAEATFGFLGSSDTDPLFWRRSLSACASNEEKAFLGKPNLRTPFLFANTDEAFQKLYKKMFRCPQGTTTFSGFDGEDDIDGWTVTPNGEISFDPTRSSKGDGSMRVCGQNYITMTSPSFNTTDWVELSNQIAIDLFTPASLPNPWWWGALSMSANVPAAGVNNQWLGNFELTNTVRRGDWTTVTFTLPTNVMAALEGDFPNAQFIFNLNVPYDTTECWGLDNLRFVGNLQPRTVFHRTGSRNLQVRTNNLMSFEVAGDWTFDENNDAVAPRAFDKVEHGAASLEMVASGYRSVWSRLFDTRNLPTVGSQLNLDVFVPDPQPNPYWVGDVQIYVHCPSANLYDRYVGQRSITHTFREEYNSVLVSLPTDVRNALDPTSPGGPRSDCRFHLVLNANSGSGRFLFDKLGFVGP